MSFIIFLLLSLCKVHGVDWKAKERWRGKCHYQTHQEKQEVACQGSAAPPAGWWRLPGAVTIRWSGSTVWGHPVSWLPDWSETTSCNPVSLVLIIDCIIWLVWLQLSASDLLSLLCLLILFQTAIYFPPHDDASVTHMNATDLWPCVLYVFVYVSMQALAGSMACGVCLLPTMPQWKVEQHIQSQWRSSYGHKK